MNSALQSREGIVAMPGNPAVPKSRRSRGALVMAAGLLIAACGHHDDDNDGGNNNGGNAGAGSNPSAVPASAGGSWAAMFAFIRVLTTDETSEPLTVDAITDPPTEETTEPTPLV